MICYNVYIPLLMRQANDVEENAGPTVFDVINPMRTVSADCSQGNEALFAENAGKQFLAMSLTAIIYHQIDHISVWTSSTLNNILTIGNNLYISIRNVYLTFDKPFTMPFDDKNLEGPSEEYGTTANGLICHYTMFIKQAFDHV